LTLQQSESDNPLCRKQTVVLLNVCIISIDTERGSTVLDLPDDTCMLVVIHV